MPPRPAGAPPTAPPFTLKHDQSQAEGGRERAALLRAQRGPGGVVIMQLSVLIGK